MLFTLIKDGVILNAFSVITAIFLGILVAIFAILLPLAIICNVKIGAKYRKPLAQKLQSLRLNKMLVAVGIDNDEYLHKESIVNIHGQMSRCSECTSTDDCDDTLSGDNIDITKIGFCNNESSLKDMLAKKRVID